MVCRWQKTLRSIGGLQKQQKFSYSLPFAAFNCCEDKFLNQERVQEVENCSVDPNFSL